ncbi:MAG: 3-methyladenine DNA glycosylase [Corynebacterium sp.]|nr:3-methyladenine DNA glycosylase [Corynebacterium sp.]
MTIYTATEAESRAQAHAARVDHYTHDHLIRRSHGEKHPVFDFLFEYYPIKPAQMAKWHPGLGNSIEAPEDHSTWKFYTETDGLIHLDLDAYWAKRGETALYIKDLLERTLTNPAHFDCFGMHEWAMVYHIEPRHNLPLRLGHEGSAAVVDEHVAKNGNIRCTHYDAFRYFAPDATNLNQQQLTRERQPYCEQRGCLHAAMDLYKWAAKLGPIVPGELFMDCFELAWDCRILDMEASPYDCRGLGFGVVPVDTPEGKAEYVRRQRELSQRATPLREQLIDLVRSASGQASQAGR